MSLYRHDNGEITEYAKLDMPAEEDIEDFLQMHPDVVERGIMIVGRQVQTSDSKWVDLLGIDKDGNVVVIEVKKGDAPRNTVSQILDYAVWASDIGYDELNVAYGRLVKNKKYNRFVKKKYDNLHAAMEDVFGSAPQPFNPGQRLYIVGEGIDEKTDDMCAYLRQNGLKIRCVSVGFFGDGDGGSGKDDGVQRRIRVVHTDADAERQDSGGDQFDRWEYNLGKCSTDLKGAIEAIRSYVENDLKCPGKISKKGATCTFHAGRTRFAVIYAYRTKDYGGFDFLSDPRHDVGDGDGVSQTAYGFGDAGRSAKIVPENIDFIKKCARYAHDAAKIADGGTSNP